jgi:hypothetical protein
MTRPLCGLLSVLTLAAINVQASAPLDPQRHPDFSGTYALLPERSVAIDKSSRFERVPDSTSGPTVVGACGTQFVIIQTATKVTISRVGSDDTAARPHDPRDAYGIYELNHSTTTAIGDWRRGGRLWWRGDALDLVLSLFHGESLSQRVEYVFRFNKDGTLTVAYMTSSSAHEIVTNSAFTSFTSVYQRTVP